MAGLPTFRRFNKSDFPASPNWFNNIFDSLNAYCEQTNSLLDQGLTIGQNVQGQKFSITFTTSASYSSGNFTPLTYSYTGGGKPNCLMIGQINRVDRVSITSPVSITDWTMNTNKSPYLITINYIAGLAANTQYNVTMVII